MDLELLLKKLKDMEGKVDVLQKSLSDLERLTTGEDGYMLISVPIGSYVLPPKEVEKQLKLKLKDGEVTKSAERQFTKEDMISFANYCITAPYAPTSRHLLKWAEDGLNEMYP